MNKESIKHKFYKFLPQFSGLRVLMYHKFSMEKKDTLTVIQNDFYDQLLYLLDDGYQFWRLKDLNEYLGGKRKLPQKVVMITMDDAYVNNAQFAEPILKKLNLKATMFLPVAWLGQKNVWDEGQEPLLNIDQLKQLTQFEFALHSYSHQNYSTLSMEQIQQDLQQCFNLLDQSGLSYEKSLAYPYGAFSKSIDAKNQLIKVFDQLNIKTSFRIGNKINPDGFSAHFINRIDVQGDDSLDVFKFKMKFGRVKL